MKKATKFILTGFLFLVVGLVFIFMWVMHWSPTAKEAWRNVENSKKIEIGMQKNEVIEIMGRPNSINQKSSSLFYSPPFMSSSGIVFFFEENRVIRIEYYEPT
ncbi:MAG: hypothetical protein JXR07_06970 [Reichenbachiella sp.]